MYLFKVSSLNFSKTTVLFYSKNVENFPFFFQIYYDQQGRFKDEYLLDTLVLFHTYYCIYEYGLEINIKIISVECRKSAAPTCPADF